jgi:hypothetical protein
LTDPQVGLPVHVTLPVKVTPDPRVPYQKPDAGIVADGAMPYWVIMPSGAKSVTESEVRPTPGVDGGEPVGSVRPPALTPVAWKLFAVTVVLPLVQLVHVTAIVA